MGLSACATSPTPSSPANVDLKKMQSETGEVCALYGWTTDNSRDFVFYSDETTARYDSVLGPVNLSAQSAFPSLKYLDPSGDLVELRLGEGESMDGGKRYPMSQIVTQTEEGWDRFHPVAIVQTCLGNKL